MLRRQRTDSLLNVLLWFLFFIAMTMKQAYGPAISSPEIHQIVQTFIKEEAHKMESFDCRLYTPTLADYKKCPRSTLTCFTTEVKVLMLEYGKRSSSLHQKRLTKRLTELTSLIKQKDGANCPKCEVHREQAANDFLTTLQGILEWMNNQGSQQPASH
ncbi:interleukin 15, like isoform X2 [Salmo salar]|uniref:Interleukin n=1 Tax=Salmo salar TaxID=8030 RepID=A0ABM3FAM4_SALSA|nr:interleukin 15, like isoform X2 [Salmo salar]